MAVKVGFGRSGEHEPIWWVINYNRRVVAADTIKIRICRNGNTTFDVCVPRTLLSLEINRTVGSFR